MEIPTGTLEQIESQVARLLARSDAPAGADADQLRQAFGQLIEVMKRLDADTGSGQDLGDEVTEIGEYALRLTEGLGSSTPSRTHQGEIAALVADIALWVAQHGGRLDSLEPVVDALALHANSIREPQQLQQLSAVFQAIVAAVGPLIRQDTDRLNPGRPWRVLLLNQSIVATRSHDIECMEQAFAVLTRYLPEDAPGFFSEGMQQMDALDYPEHVRKVMQRYHRQWTLSRSLH